MSSRATCGSEEYCAADECGRKTPACDQAHAVNPEQSNPVSGLVPPHWYGSPITEYPAARTAATLPLGAGGGAMVPPPPLVAASWAAASAAAWAASASWYLRSSVSYSSRASATRSSIVACCVSSSASTPPCSATTPRTPSPLP